MANSSISLSSNLTLDALGRRNDPIPLAALSNYKYGIFILFQILGKRFGGWQPFNHAKGFETAIQPAPWVFDIVGGSTSVVNGLLRIPLGNTASTAFRLGDVVSKDYGRLRGQVFKKEPGFIYVQPIQGATMAQLQAEYTAGSQIVSRWDSSPNTGSGPKEPQYFNPEVDYNYTSVSREAAVYSHRDNASLLFLDEDRGGYRLYNDAQTISKLLGQTVDKLFSDVRSRETRYDGRVYDSNGGIEWSIMNRGGDYWQRTGPITRNELESRLGRVWDKVSNRRDPLILGGGRVVLNEIQRLYADPQFPSKMLDTFGGEDIKGLNLREIEVGRMRFVLMDLEHLNDPYRNGNDASLINGESKNAQKLYVLDFSDVESATGEGGMLPAVRLMHWKDSGPFVVSCSKGVFDGNKMMDLKGAKAQAMAEKYFTQSRVDESAWDVACDIGIDFVGAHRSMFSEMLY